MRWEIDLCSSPDLSTLPKIARYQAIRLRKIGWSYSEIAKEVSVSKSTLSYWLRAKKIDCGLVNLRYLKPLPDEALTEVLSRVPRAVTLEEAVVDGGVGSAIASLIVDRRIRCELLRIGVPSAFVEPGSSDELCRIYGLDADGVMRRILAFWTLDV